MNGVLVIDKPAGPTSHDIVAVVRRAIGETRVGHTGTLDPLATGVLPLVIGRATRLASLMSGADKEYVARIRFGVATDTYDAENHDTPAATVPPDPGLDEAAIRDALPAFAGRYLQTPPAFSAKKIAGTPAYKLARQGKLVEVKPVEVNVTEIGLRSYSAGVAEVQVVCSSGFYVRSLAHDLGQRLGCGAHLEGLRRTRAGEFTLDDAVTLEAIVGVGEDGPTAILTRLIPMERLLTHLPAVVVSALGAKRASHGGDLRPEDLATRSSAPGKLSGDRLRLLDGSGALLGLAESRADGLLHPVVVLV
jgi:tRNA pseudouridine55 synthase